MTDLISKVVILLVLLISKVFTREVYIRNVSELLGTDGIHLRCIYTTDPGDQVVGVNFLAMNDSTDTFVNIAESTVLTNEPRLFPYGEYLFSNANITKVNDLPSEVVLSFNDLKCKHERNYRCSLVIYNHAPIFSAPIEIVVQVSPTKPETLVMIYTPINDLMTTERPQVNNPKFSDDSTDNSSFSTSNRNDTNQTTPLYKFKALGIDNHITSNPYNATVDNNTTEPWTKSASIMEGDNITFKCSGNVGQPAGFFLFKKISKARIPPMNFTATTTEIDEIEGNCSYYRTSYLTIQVTAEDNQAVIRCLVVSPLAGDDMFIDSEQLDVKYTVREPNVTKYPDKQEYIVGVDTSITLTCTTDGNPTPIYRWYKDNHDDIISTDCNFSITDINTTNSDLYICNVTNTINCHTYTKAAEMDVNIMNEGSLSGADDENGISSGDSIPIFVSVLGLLVIAVFLIVMMIYIKRKISNIPKDKTETESFVDCEPKPVTESITYRTGNYDFIESENDANKIHTVHTGHKVEDINKHNTEYLKKQEEDEHKKKESNKPPQFAEYSQVNEATRIRNKQKTETRDNTDKQEEDTYAETQEGIYDKAGDRRHKENEHVEHFDSSKNLCKQNSTADHKLSKQTCYTGSYDNQAFRKDVNSKIATVSPTIRSLNVYQDDEQTDGSRDSKSRKEIVHIKGTDQTGTSDEDKSHETEL